MITLFAAKEPVAVGGMHAVTLALVATLTVVAVQLMIYHAQQERDRVRAAAQAPTQPLPVLRVAGAALYGTPVPPAAPDNVIAFELGRRAERAAHHPEQ